MAIYDLGSLQYKSDDVITVGESGSKKKSMPKGLLMGVIGLLVMVAVIVAAIAMGGSDELINGLVAFTVLAVFGAFFGTIFYMIKKGGQLDQNAAEANKGLDEWKKFAERNGLVFHEPGDDPNMGASVGFINIAEDVALVDPCTETTIERDGSTTTTYVMGGSTEMRFKLPRKVPHVIIRPAGSSMGFNSGTYEFRAIGGGITPGMREALMDVKTIELEGDFGRVFEVKIPKEYHIDVLQLLTPDVMEAMLEYGEDYHFMLYEDTFTVMMATLGSPESLQERVGGIQTIAGHMLQQVRSYSDARMGDYELNAVTEGGKELRQSRKIKAYQTTFFVVYGGMFALAFFGGNVMAGGIPLRLWGFFGVAGMLGGVLLIGLVGEVVKRARRLKYKADKKRREKH